MATLIASAEGLAATGGILATGLVLLGILLVFAPLGIWTVASGIRKDNRRAADEICRRLDALIAAAGGKVIEDRGAIENAAITASRIVGAFSPKQKTERSEDKPRTTGGYSSIRKGGWNR